MKSNKEMKADHLLRMNWTAQDEYYHGKQVTEEEAEVKRKAEEPDRIRREQEREMLWEEEKKRERAWKDDHWVCLEGGEGYYDCRD